MPALRSIPAETLDWLLAAENPAVATLTRRTLLGEVEDSPATTALWQRRNEYAPVAAILSAMRQDGSWDTPTRDYQKYAGSLWQIHFLGEMWADGADERVRRGTEYALSRQLDCGAWAAGPNRNSAIQCLTANVGRALARMGWARDERIVAALAWIVAEHREKGPLVCAAGGSDYTINGYCHMLAPKLLLFLAEVPRELWPDGVEDVRNAAICALRDKQVFRCLPEGAREYMELAYSARKGDVRSVREAWLAEHPDPEYAEKPGWKRLGFPLSYNSDALEALAALMAAGEPPRQEYSAAIELVRSQADPLMRWAIRNSFNGKMIADVEARGKPSRWLTLRALQVLAWADAG